MLRFTAVTPQAFEILEFPALRALVRRNAQTESARALIDRIEPLADFAQLQNDLRQLAEMIARHPRLRFQCFLSSRHANQSLCTLARELPNFSLAGYWWHNFFPDVIRQVIGERLDMLPLNKQIGFFSDAYCVEWSYASGGETFLAVMADIDRKTFGLKGFADERGGFVHTPRLQTPCADSPPS